MMEVYVGTSGWMYDWNPDGLEWYVRNSSLNAIELNMSFYSFPRLSQISKWRKIGSKLRWSIKVHRSITHYRKLSAKSFETWARFRNLFKPMSELIDFFLFQFPPSVKPTKIFLKRIKYFLENVDNDRIAMEFRDVSWFNLDLVNLISKWGAVFVSVDSPMMCNAIYSSNGIVYLRLHGRTYWYSHNYILKELRDIVARLLTVNPSKIYVFFNNDHDMLHNAREMKKLLEKSINTRL